MTLISFKWLYGAALFTLDGVVYLHRKCTKHRYFASPASISEGQLLVCITTKQSKIGKKQTNTQYFVISTAAQTKHFLLFSTH